MLQNSLLINSAVRGLGIIGFASDRPAEMDRACPFARIEMPVLLGARYEIWPAMQSPSYQPNGDIVSARDQDMIFGVMTLEDAEGDALAARVYQAYADLFAFTEGAHLLRVWNYLPRITADSPSGDQTPMERYRHFNLGRHNAFDRYYAGKLPPAASCLGTQGGALIIYFLLGAEAGIPIENPRQIAAYRYPTDYGPKSPNFSRALLGQMYGRDVLFISGTASIVGHKSLHAGDAASQTKETLINITALLDEAKAHDFTARPDTARLKVYVRRPEDLPIVRPLVEDMFSAPAEIVYLHADICRDDLLVEIEALVFDRS